MFDSLRQAMLWAHRVLGLGFSALLLVAFFMGSLALYDRELDSWMLPELRVAPAAAPLSLDQQVLPRVAGLSEGKALLQWYVELPDARRPLPRFQAWSVEHEGFSRFLLPGNDAEMSAAGSRGGDFFYRLHYTLNINAWNFGTRLLGLAAMVGLIALLAGVCIHTRLFQDLFTLRADKAPRRLLDLHNLTGVFALPFHALILLSGVLILFPLYLPAAIDALYPGQAEHFATQANDAFSRPAAGTPGPLASIDSMLVEARQHWGGGAPAFVRVWHPGDANAYVEVSRSLADRLSLDGQTLYFEGASGQLLHVSRLPPAAATLDVLAGLHVAHFHQPGLRALYFFAGISGCVMLASGLLYWLAKRRLQHAARDRGGMAMTLLCSVLITGMPLATLAMLVSNRCLPLALSGRADWEVRVFFAAWLLAGLHALWVIGRCPRARAPWAAQCLAISLLALLAVLLNAWSTGDHPWRALSQGLWAVAGVDLALLASALLVGGLSWRLHRSAAAGQRSAEVKDA